MTRSILLLLGIAYVQAQEITTYGPWQGYWTLARLSAYSPHDRIDAVYRATKGDRWRWITADGRTDVRESPYGIAASGQLSFGTRIFIPSGLGYLDHSRPLPHQRVFGVDDRGALLKRFDGLGSGIALDVRYRTEHSALAFGIKEAWVFVITSERIAREEGK